MENTLQTYSQWVKITITSNAVLSIQKAEVSSGKFCNNSDPDFEIKPSEIDKIPISPSVPCVITATGKKGAPVGTEGSFEIWYGPSKLGKYHWNCPYWSSTNQSNWTDGQSYSSYKVRVSPSGDNEGPHMAVQLDFLLS